MVDPSRKDHWSLKQQMIDRGVRFLEETLWVPLAQPVLTENLSSWRINQIFWQFVFLRCRWTQCYDLKLSAPEHGLPLSLWHQINWKKQRLRLQSVACLTAALLPVTLSQSRGRAGGNEHRLLLPLQIFQAVLYFSFRSPSPMLVLWAELGGMQLNAGKMQLNQEEAPEE